MKSFLLIVCLAICAVAVQGCASTGSAIVTGTARTPVKKEQVKIYLEAPKSYEVIGVVESVGYVGMTDQRRMNRAIDELKERAGKIGANGVLLESAGNVAGPTVGTYNNGVFMAANSRHKAASGKAIWVKEE